MKRLACVLVTLVILTSLVFAAPRTWTDRTGKQKIEAELVDYQDGKVQLRKSDGSEVSVPLSKLSAADQRFVRAELKRRKDGAAEAPRTDRVSSTTLASAAAGEWPQWRGPHRDGLSEETGLLDSWPEDGPPMLWQASGLGGGYSSVVVSGGKVFTLGNRQGEGHLIALDAQTGEELWAARVGPGDPNGTPTADGNLVFGLGAQGDLVCCEAATGREVWRKNFERDFGGKMMSGWGFSESPLVDGERLICTPGGDGAAMAALDKATGNVVWRTAMPQNTGAGYSSIVASEGARVRQYVQLTGRGVIGVAAKDGQLLWGYERVANGTANIPTPIVKDDYVFCSSGYNTGAALLKLEGRGGSVNASEVYFLEPQVMQNHHGGMVLVGDHVYCGHGHNNGFPLCIELLTGKVAWSPGRGAGEGSAAVVYADGDLYFRYQNAVMALIEATPERYNLKSSFEIATRNGESWAHPVIAGGRLFLRDQDVLHCYDVKQK